MTLIDITEDIESVKKQLDVMDVLKMAEKSDATVLITEEYSAYLTQVVQSIFKISNTKLKRSSNVWNHNGLCCTILGGSVKKSKVAKELWEVLQEPDELDLTDLFPYGSRCYPVDYTLETAQPAVL